MLNFCTLFDSNYLSRGLAMFNSLIQHCPNSNLFIICLDDILYQYLLDKQLAGITPIQLKEVEAFYKELEPAKQNRSYVEYIFTLSPIIALYVLEKYPKIKMVTTLDADIYFFSDPSVLFEGEDSFSVAVTPHRFNKNKRFMEKYGKYNVSFQSFKNDEIGISCLKKWKNDCIDWCYDRYEVNKFADQKYLDEWDKLFPNVKEFKIGSGVAPWNIKNNDLTLDLDGNLLYRDEPLIFYHFNGLRNLHDNYLSLSPVGCVVIKRNKIIKYLYSKYVNELAEIPDISVEGNNKIRRTMHLNFGKKIYFWFLADLYKYRDGSLVQVFNFSSILYLLTTIKSFIKNQAKLKKQ
jgi:hypothetical protein